MPVIKVRWAVDELSNIMTLYTHEKVCRSLIPAPYSWVEITAVGTRPALVAGQDIYVFDDTTGATTSSYCIAHYNTGSGAESDKSAAILGSARLNDFLTLRDLYALVGSQRVRQLFDDDNDASLDDSLDIVDTILAQAEGECYARLLRAFGSKTAVITVAQNDQAIRMHTAWIALELASERRPEFLGADGRGAFSWQYERAVNYFEALAKGKLRTRGDSAATNAQEGGMISPPRTSPTDARFIFAPCKNSSDGHGGY